MPTQPGKFAIRQPNREDVGRAGRCTRIASHSAAIVPPKVAAYQLGISVWTLARWRERGEGPDVIVYGCSGGKRCRYYYDVRALDAFIAKRTRPFTGSEAGS